MTLELEGRIKTKLPAQGGTSARGAWTRQDFVVEYQDGNYMSEACFSAWGQDRVDELAKFGEGDAVKVLLCTDKTPDEGASASASKQLEAMRRRLEMQCGGTLKADGATVIITLPKRITV